MPFNCVYLPGEILICLQKEPPPLQGSYAITVSHRKPWAMGPWQDGKLDAFQTNTEIFSVINFM